MSNQNIEAVEAYIYSLKEKDLSRAPLADDVVAVDPIAGEIKGANAFRGFLSNFLPVINGVRIHQHISEGDCVATRWEADTSFGLIQIFEMFRVKDGLIIEAIGYFDPRPIIGN
jgi:limonene-1,2-epoxide hydrolase